MPLPGRRRPIRTPPLCRGYERAPEAASISYAAIRIFESNSPQSGLTTEIDDGSLSYRRRKIPGFDLWR